MRWLYYDPLRVEEVEYHTAATTRFHKFWHAFGQKVSVLENALSGGTAWDWHRWLNELLANVDRRFHWEIIPEDRSDRWRMIVTAETHRTARPLLRDFLAAAPQIPGWSFHYWLPQLPYPLARRWARQRCGGDCDHLAVRVRRGKARNLELQFTPVPDAPPGSPQSWLTVAYAASEAILGEKTFDQMIGSVSMAEPAEGRTWWRMLRKPTSGNEAVAMADLGATAAAHLAELRNDLPAAPLARLIDSRGWTTLELESLSDIVGSRRNDIRLLTASVAALPLLTAAHTSRRFCSEQHSRHGETFCYVQWQHDTTNDEQLLVRREQLEGIIARSLSENESGCVIGGGIGEKFLYFDLAITDLSRAVPQLRRSLVAHRPPQLCWLRFYDDELAAEWVGIHPDAPDPPGIED